MRMSKSKARKPDADSFPKKGRPNGGVSTDRASHSSEAHLLISSPPVDLDAELSGKIKDLVRLAQEQGHLTYNDISEALPENAIVPEKLDEIFAKLRSLEIEIVDQAEVDRVKTPETEEEDSPRLDILDDPVRMYLKQMGQVALLTREQEVDISKRIEAAENDVTQNHLQPRFCRQGAHRPRRKTPRRAAAGTVRPRHSRQESGQSRRAPARASPAGDAGRGKRTSRWMNNTPLAGCAQQVQTQPRAGGVQAA